MEYPTLPPNFTNIGVKIPYLLQGGKNIEDKWSISVKLRREIAEKD